MTVTHRSAIVQRPIRQYLRPEATRGAIVRAQKKKYAIRKHNRHSPATTCTGTPPAGVFCTPKPVVPVVMRSFESWFTASDFRCRSPCSSACCLSREIVALASVSCAFKSSDEVGIAAAMAPMVVCCWLLLLLLGVESRALLSRAFSGGAVDPRCGVTAAGEGEE